MSQLALSIRVCQKAGLAASIPDNETVLAKEPMSGD